MLILFDHFNLFGSEWQKYSTDQTYRVSSIDRQLWVATGRPENKNLLFASGCFDMILKGFISDNTPYNFKIKPAQQISNFHLKSH
jgi:hypothetical protein